MYLHSSHLPWVYKIFEFVYIKNKSSVNFNTVVCIFNETKANLFVINLLTLNISGVNFCKIINFSLNLDRKSFAI